MHKFAIAIADACLAKNWIQEMDKPLCIYAVEKKLYTVLFFLLIILLGSMLNALPQMAIYTFVFYFLRKRLGGCHAPSAWLCQIISISLVLIITFLVGPIMLNLRPLTLWCFNIIIIIIALTQKPIYPPQTHFDQKVVVANNKKKNSIILIIAGLQLCFGRIYKELLVFSMLAVLTGIISVYIEVVQQSIQRKKVYYEEN